MSEFKNVESEKVPLKDKDSLGPDYELNHKNSIAGNLHQVNYKDRWYILFFSSFSWFAVYHCLTALSVIEATLLKDYNLSNVEYSLLYSLQSVFNIPGMLMVSVLISKYNIHNTLTITQTIVSIGQVLVVIGSMFADYSSDELSNHFYIFLIITYIGRCIFGIGGGLAEVIVLLIIEKWFNNTKWLATATMLASAVVLELGSFSARYLIEAIYDINDLLWESLMPGLIISLISVIGALGVNHIAERGGTVSVHANNNDSNINTDGNEHGNENVRGLFIKLVRNTKQMSVTLWLTLLGVMVVASFFYTFFSQMTVPVMIAFDISQIKANIILSMSPVFSMIFVPLWSYINSKFGMHKQFFVCSFMLMFIGISIITGCYISAINNVNTCAMTSLFGDDYLDALNPIATVAMLCQNIGAHWAWANGLTIMYNEAGDDNTNGSMVETATTVVGIMYSTAGLIETQLFGTLADETHNYTSSLLMLAMLPLFGFIVALMTAKQMKSIKN